MAKKFQSEQEVFWAGSFGDEYTIRNNTKELLLSKKTLLNNALKSSSKLESVIEFGANVGLNLIAVKDLIPGVAATAVEINSSAISKLKMIDDVKVIHGSILESNKIEMYDLAMVIGVLIHIAPKYLPLAYENIYRATRRYILIGEYYSRQPEEVSYRGYKNRLFKRDFAGEMLDKYTDLRLVDYGFFYHKDESSNLDDITWFLMEKADI